MRTLSHLLLCSTAACLPLLGPAQTPPPSSTRSATTERPHLAAGADTPAATTASKLQITPPEAVEHSIRQLAGRPVHGANGERLGTIKDFVIDKHTGEVVYAVVSSGGVLGAGDTLRLVPLRALKPAPDGSPAFTLKLDRVGWNSSPPLIDEAFGAGLVPISDEQRRALSQLYGMSLPAPRTPAAAATTPPPNPEAERAASPWARASQLRGKNLHAANQPLGTIDDLVIDLAHGKAAALVDPADDVIAGNTRVLVPLTELSLKSDGHSLATTFTRHDFVQLDTASRQRADASLLPTGRTDAQPPTSPKATLASALRSARQALDQDPDLARADLQVAAENGQLILRGRVRTDRLKERAEDAVKQAASGLSLQNNITVDPAPR